MSQPPVRFHFNNSSLPILACSRRYVNQVVRGAKLPNAKTESLNMGITFHHFMKLYGSIPPEAKPGPSGIITPIGLMDLIMNKDLYPPEAARLKQTDILNLAEAVDRLHTEHAELFADCKKELFFEIPQNLYIGDEHVICDNCGTMDLISYMVNEDCVYLTDYKTTMKEINGELVTQYKLTSQRPFYEIALLNLPAGTLPDHYMAAIKKKRIKFAYWFYNWKTKQDVLLNHQWINESSLQQFGRMIEEKKQYAAFLHLHPELAIKEGIMFGQCFRCPFTSICETNDDAAEAQLMDKWAAGFEKYYPKH